MADLSKYAFISKLKALPFVDEIWLFGSRARGDHSERSDIDLAILCPKASESDWHQVLEIVENADTLLKIDCLQFDRLRDDDKLKINILQFKKVLYQRGEK